MLGANSEPCFTKPADVAFFFEEDESGITVGLLNVLQDCKLIYYVIIMPAITVWLAVETYGPVLLTIVPFGVGIAEPTPDWFVISCCCGTPRLRFLFSKKAV
jgi:hypothetical protein